MSDDPTPQQLVTRLAGLLTLEQLSADSFLAPATPADAVSGMGRLFGGQVIAQALSAAEMTVDAERPVHSLHAYFLRMGDDAKPVRCDVSRDLDGGSFSNRRVTAAQGDRPILTMTASFQRREEGLHHQDEIPDVPGPEGLESDIELRRRIIDKFPEERRAAFSAPRPIELRSVEPSRWIDPKPQAPVSHTWMRAVAEVGDDPRLNRAMLAYASDLGMMPTAMLPHGMSGVNGDLLEASLDHAIWFHDDFRMDEWILLRTESAWAGRGRGFITGKFFRRDGKLIASVSQEGMMRLINKNAKKRS